MEMHSAGGTIRGVRMHTWRGRDRPCRREKDTGMERNKVE